MNPSIDEQITAKILFDISWGGAADCLLSEDLPKDEEGETTGEVYRNYKISCKKRFDEAFVKALDSKRNRVIDEVIALGIHEGWKTSLLYHEIQSLRNKPQEEV
jgi:hypothetical protein